MTPAEHGVKVVLDHIEAHFEHTTTLRSLARISGLSPNHLQQMFTRIVGLSPTMFLGYRRCTRFKELLRSGESIGGAAHAVGYGSSRAVYEKAGSSLGMTPATYGRGGAGVQVRYAVASGARGLVLAAWTDRGICALKAGEEDGALLRELIHEFPRSCLVPDGAMCEAWIAAVKACPPEDPLLQKWPLRVRRDLFQAKLWDVLMELDDCGLVSLPGRSG